MQATGRKVAAPPSAFARGPRRCRRQCAMSFGWRAGGHRCRRRGNGAAFSHGLAGRCTGAPGSVRERTGAIISPRVGSREADTKHTDQPHGCPRRPSWRRDERNAAKPRGSARRGDWCWVRFVTPESATALIRGRVIRPHGFPGLAALARGDERAESHDRDWCWPQRCHLSASPRKSVARELRRWSTMRDAADQPPT